MKCDRNYLEEHLRRSSSYPNMSHIESTESTQTHSAFVGKKIRSVILAASDEAFVGTLTRVAILIVSTL